MFGPVWECVKVGECMCVDEPVHVNVCPCAEACAQCERVGVFGVLKVCARVCRRMCLSRGVDLSSCASFCPARGKGGAKASLPAMTPNLQKKEEGLHAAP